MGLMPFTSAALQVHVTDPSVNVVPIALVGLGCLDPVVPAVVHSYEKPVPRLKRMNAPSATGTSRVQNDTQ